MEYKEYHSRYHKVYLKWFKQQRIRPLFKGSDFEFTIKVVSIMQNIFSSDETGFEMHVNAVKREVENYLDPQMIVSPKTDPLQWWRENRFLFPKI